MEHYTAQSFWVSKKRGKIKTENLKKIINKDIFVNSIKQYDEIILIGSGKGVTSVKTINQINWKRKSLKFYKLCLRHYSTAIKNSPNYN